MPARPTAADGPTRFVLVGTRHAGNVGAAARAMKVMGHTDLVLVAPRDPEVRSQHDAVAMASGAGDVLARARVVPTLDEALDGITWAAATAMTPRDFGPPVGAPREVLPAVAAAGHRVAFVFGGERHGLSNEDVYRCHHCLSIPTFPGYGSLNLAQAVQVIAYEWRQALGAPAVVDARPGVDAADGPAVQGVLDHWQRVLEAVGFLDPASPKKLMPRLHQVLNRASLTMQEVHILRGIARHVEDAAGRPPQA